MAGEPPLVPELHGKADDLMPFRAQHGRDGRGVDSTGHGDGDSLRGGHFVCDLLAALSFCADYFFRSSGAGSFLTLSTACAVGFTLAPLRG